MLETRYEVAALAARWVVEDGLDYGSAKQRALQSHGLHGRSALPDNALMEEAVREYIATFCSDSQAAQLLALRQCALYWMDRLAVYRPYLTGAVWNGTATRLSDIHLQLFCDDCKSAELTLIDQGVKYSANSAPGFKGASVPVLSVSFFCKELGENIGVHLLIYDHDDLRGAVRASDSVRTVRANAQSLRRLLAGMP